ncbi:hypothetical protein J4457_03100, partial [Candidatus Woesearchaeota archaeon]|nr:hypothetical protein [Candidatus Woesearchaeota archaeon]
TMNPTSEAIALLAFTAYKDAEKWKIEKKYRNSHLPKNIFSIINIKNELMAIGESRQTDSIVLDGGEIKLMTIHELIAALSNHTLTLDKIKIFQGAEYLFEKIVESK